MNDYQIEYLRDETVIRIVLRLGVAKSSKTRNQCTHFLHTLLKNEYNTMHRAD